MFTVSSPKPTEKPIWWIPVTPMLTSYSHATEEESEAGRSKVTCPREEQELDPNAERTTPGLPEFAGSAQAASALDDPTVLQTTWGHGVKVPSLARCWET